MDRYGSYPDLAAQEREGVDYRIIEMVRPSPVAVLAPHGGCIEPTTSLIAAAIAGDDYSLYCFEGLRRGRPHGDLHLTSDRFDEPRARRLVSGASIAV
ncbi:MAG: replication protein, partial [Alphaproteobacteria bacterium]